MPKVESKGQETGNERREFAVCRLLCAILAFALLWPVVRRPGWWIWTPGADHSDLAVTHWPNAHFTRRALWEDKQFPLWRPTIMSGTPFAANPLAGLYYLPNWFLLFLLWLPLEVGFNLSALVHLWLAGAAMYALLRRGFEVGVWGALAAAVVYEASPKLLAHLGAGHVGWVQAWGWLPVVMLCWLQVAKCASCQMHKWAVGGGVALAMQFCADVRMAAYTLIAAVTLVLAWVLNQLRGGVRGEGNKETRGRGATLRSGVRYWGLSLVIFLGLTACQWLPMVALLSETTRVSMTLRDAAVWSLPWQYLAGLLLANHGGFHEWMTYVGVSTLVLAGVGVGVLCRKRKEHWWAGWLVSLLVGAAWFSLGENGGLFLVLWRVVPGLGLLRVPPRAWVLVIFSMAVLAGFGVEEVQRRGNKGARRRKRWRQALLLAVGVFPPLLVLGYWLSVGSPPLNLVMFGVVTLLAVVIYNVQRVKHNTRWVGWAIVLFVIVDLLVVDVTLIEARPPEDVFADGRAAAEWLAGQSNYFRAYSPSYSIPQHVAELYGLELADGVDPLQLRVYADYLTRAAGLESRGYGVTLPLFPDGGDISTALEDVVPDAEMMGLLGVKYVATAFPIADREWQLVGQFDEVYVYENLHARLLLEVDGGSIVLADGTTLFRYRSWPVYVGWAVSGVMVIVLLVGWSRGRRDNG
ncbi:MAG: hypothetical protein GY832_20645 [Chloroflexi bacterium]|nr:hypothetical protein [Chloroflexota bacterium]